MPMQSLCKVWKQKLACLVLNMGPPKSNGLSMGPRGRPGYGLSEPSSKIALENTFETVENKMD